MKILRLRVIHPALYPGMLDQFAGEIWRGDGGFYVKRGYDSHLSWVPDSNVCEAIVEDERIPEVELALGAEFAPPRPGELIDAEFVDERPKKKRGRPRKK